MSSIWLITRLIFTSKKTKPCSKIILPLGSICGIRILEPLIAGTSIVSDSRGTTSIRSMRNLYLSTIQFVRKIMRARDLTIRSRVATALLTRRLSRLYTRRRNARRLNGLLEPLYLAIQSISKSLSSCMDQLEQVSQRFLTLFNSYSMDIIPSSTQRLWEVRRMRSRLRHLRTTLLLQSNTTAIFRASKITRG